MSEGSSAPGGPFRVGNVNVGDLQGSVVNVGSHNQIRNTAHAPAAEVLAPLRSLREQLRELAAQGGLEPLSADDVADARAQLDDLEDELRRPEPRGDRLNRLVRGLGRVLEGVGALAGTVSAVAAAVHSLGLG